MRAHEFITEKWTKKYKKSINCSSPKGFSQKAHCAGRKKNEGVAEGVPQPGSSSGAPKQFGADAQIQTRQMTVKDIISSVPGVPYYNNVVDDWDSKDYSWGVTKKVIEYATYLKDHPESLSKLPPAIVLNGKFEDGAHRVSAIWLLQQRMDPKNPLWKNAKLNVQFVKQGVAEDLDENLRKWFKDKWVRFGPDGKIRGDCARGSEKEGKPKCLPQSKAHALGKKGRATAASRKRREDPNANRSGKAINVKTK